MANRSQDEDKVLKPKTTTQNTPALSETEQKAQNIAAQVLAANQNRPLTTYPWTQPKTTPTTTTPTTTPVNTSYSGGGSGGGGGSSSKAASTPLSTERNLIGSLGNYDPAAYESYTAALQALETARGQLPGYNNTYGNQLNDLYAQITGREAFSYDLDSDPLYQQYRDMYMMQGQQAMMDTMGQAAALTGGYGSTYSQAVGQQQYNAYLQDLNAVVPDLYQNAYSRWQDEGDRLLNQYGIVSDLADTEYGRYRDQMSDYWNNVDYAQQQADLEYNRGLSEWEREYQLNEDKRAQQADDYDRLMQLMQIGYAPNADEISAAGMSEAEAAAWQKYIKSQLSSGGGGGGSGPGNDYSLSTAATDELNYQINRMMTNDYINPAVRDGEDSNHASMDRAGAEAHFEKSLANNPNLTADEREIIKETVMGFYGMSPDEIQRKLNE